MFTNAILWQIHNFYYVCYGAIILKIVRHTNQINSRTQDWLDSSPQRRFNEGDLLHNNQVTRSLMHSLNFFFFFCKLEQLTIWYIAWIRYKLHEYWTLKFQDFFRYSFPNLHSYMYTSDSYINTKIKKSNTKNWHFLDNHYLINNDCMNKRNHCTFKWL